MKNFEELSFEEMQSVEGGSPMGSDPIATIGYYAGAAWCSIKNFFRNEMANSGSGGRILGPTGNRYM